MFCELTWKQSSRFPSSGLTKENSRKYLLVADVQMVTVIQTHLVK